MLTRLIVYFAYFVKSSRRYRSCKSFFYNLLENPDSRIKAIFDVFMILLVMLSVYLLIYGVGNQLGRMAEYFEMFVVTVFVCEYLLRGWLYSDSHKILLEYYEKAVYLGVRFRLSQALRQIVVQKIKYALTPVAIIDLLAILPSYRPLRILRLFLIFRLLKLFRYSQSIKVFTVVFASKRFELFTLAVFMGFLVFIASTAIYMFENQRSGGQIRHFYDAIYWSVVTISTVGYGDITPQSTGGRLVTLALILSGLGVLAFFTSILVAAFHDKMGELMENRIYAEIEKYNDFVILCGFGRVGQEIARQMQKDRKRCIIIDNDEQRVLEAKKLDFLVIQDDASKNAVLENAGIKRGASAVLCTTGNDITNVYVTLSSRYLNPEITIISRANRQDNVNKLLQAGASHVIQPFQISGLLAAESLGQPVASEAILGILREEKGILFETIVVPAESFIDSFPIGEVDFEQRKLTLVGVISSNPVHRKHKNRYKVQNQHFYFNPAPQFVLQRNDILVLLGREFSIDHFNDQIEKSRLSKSKKLWL